MGVDTVSNLSPENHTRRVVREPNYTLGSVKIILEYMEMFKFMTYVDLS